jgi:hypothetical protein
VFLDLESGSHLTIGLDVLVAEVILGALLAGLLDRFASQRKEFDVDRARGVLSDAIARHYIHYHAHPDTTPARAIRDERRTPREDEHESMRAIPPIVLLALEAEVERADFAVAERRRPYGEIAAGDGLLLLLLGDRHANGTLGVEVDGEVLGEVPHVPRIVLAVP